MYKLVISDDEGHTTVVPLLRDEITIGRNEGNTIRLTERNVSRRHAKLFRKNGSYVVEDLGSYNGVTINGERLEGKAELRAGDQLGIGDYALAFQSDAMATARPQPSAEPKAHPSPRLVVVSEPAVGAEFSLSKPVLRIGRDERLDIWINHKSISHEHAEVQVNDGRVTIFDLESANGMRVNGIQASRAVLEAGDTVELGEVRLRFLAPQGAHSLEALPDDLPAKNVSPPSRKPIFALGLVGLLFVAGAGAVLATLQGTPMGVSVDTPSTSNHEIGPVERRTAPPRAPLGSQAQGDPGRQARGGQEQGGDAVDPGAESADAPREWEQQLARAGRALSKGRLDRAYTLANELPVDSVLRETPEFGEIRYRYAEAHLLEARRALERKDSDRAYREASLVLELPGATNKQRQEARRLARRARQGTGSQNR
jgi:pSer/pThr/pTyr-binding forkhead associated (FHA) protein